MKSVANEKALQEWVIPHFEAYLDDAKRLHTLFRLTTEGISSLVEFPRVDREIALLESHVRGHDPRPQRQDLEELATLAKREVDDGFAITCGQFSVDVWALLEASVRGLVATWLANDDSWASNEMVMRLKVRVGEYETQAGPAKFRFIAHALEREAGSGVRSGVERFESVLRTVGLDGPIPRRMADTLFELSQVRNCIVHNARRVDHQLVSACPWLKLSEGSMVRVGYAQAHCYYAAMADYSVLMLARVCARCGVPSTKTVESIWETWLASRAPEMPAEEGAH